MILAFRSPSLLGPSPSHLAEGLAFLFSYVALNLVVHIILVIAFGNSEMWKKAKPQKRLEWSFLIAATAFYFIMNYYFYTEVCVGSAATRDHVRGFDATAEAMCLFVFATMAYFFIFEVLTSTVSVIMAVHHAFIVVVWAASFYYRESIYYLYLGSPFEISSIFMCFFTLMGDLQMRDTMLFKINGVVWWFSYLLCRFIWGAFIVYSVVSELIFCYGLSKESCDARSPVVVIAMLVSVLGLYGMTCLWFNKITKGMLKALGYGKLSKRKE